MCEVYNIIGLLGRTLLAEVHIVRFLKVQFGGVIFVRRMLAVRINIGFLTFSMLGLNSECQFRLMMMHSEFCETMKSDFLNPITDEPD